MMNPADFFMDVIAGKMERKGFPDFHKTDLFDLWDENRGTYEELAAKAFVPAEPILTSDILANEGAGYMRSTWIFLHRSCVQYTKTGEANFFDVILCLFTGLFLGIMYPKVALSTSANSFLMYSFGLGLDIGLSTLRVFGDAKVVYWREASPGAGMGLSSGAFFVAKTIVELPRLMILTAVNAFCFVAFAEPECDYGAYVAFAFMFSWAISGYATLFSIAMDGKSAQLLLVIVLLVFLLFAGIETILSRMPYGELIFSVLSPNRWLVESLVTCNSNSLPASYRLPNTWYASATDSTIAVLYHFSYSEQMQYPVQVSQTTRDTTAAGADLYAKLYNDTNNGFVFPTNRNGLDLNSLINFWLGLVLRMLAFLVMLNTNREKMGKESYSALFNRKVLHPIFDWLIAVETKAMASFAPQEQTNPVHSTREDVNNIRHNDGDAVDLRERGLTEPEADSAGKSRSGSTVQGANAV